LIWTATSLASRTEACRTSMPLSIVRYEATIPAE
jgi:hypothetical protein